MSRLKEEIITFFAQSVIGLGLTLIALKVSFSYIYPELDQRKKVKNKAGDILKKMGFSDPPTLTEYESTILLSLVDPSDGGSYNDIIGYSDIISTLKRRIVYPLLLSFKKNDKLLQPPKGVLLYGHPGVGKTKIARTVAGECGCRFINCDMSIMMDKYYGESQKMISALFSLAQKLQPVIIFIDEIESFLRTRNETDNEVNQAFKAQFMSQWDGFNESNSKIVIMAASNLPTLIDPAILRRMPVKIEIPLPDAETRIAMFKHYLPSLDLNNEKINIIDEIATKSQGLSCADVVEISRIAVIDKVGELIDSIEILDDNFEKNMHGIENVNHVNSVSAEDLLRSVTTFVKEKSGTVKGNQFNFQESLREIFQTETFGDIKKKYSDILNIEKAVDELGVD
ncbi:AAA+ ATPase domain and ATPase, AAA-type, core domain and P-loop containing nucleoside triphosphate hydrolase domain-containing protein [Strongyloides ratti]|uniref:AAA+ ATPase domain and ATPase, AAA-type, core domain and P-loop containing nucleoside triphosphate hydrolase domain-containing protein n=1 Tax=Strongyloides ratti TaxID=34506 RepID=A0A090MXH6_STRRB|nr:AAA+ ATPase domain and ATPase, AAA-type, core domain and P-loop containing nucleoside triphosphate hydrolase domain-containing protein [Strongyloides ratti]CEF65449.1 AAA+ ATPase domain and ATPase, AAA-type, core domain and P-loop containing nucleoside triphosphate hydrolase domain-containing protein [Strongyloides ratti]